MKFASAVEMNQNKPTKVRTTNGAKAFSQTGENVLNYFSKVGALRGQDTLPLFLNAYADNQELAVRALLWARDVRNGAGERKAFRDVLKYLCNSNPDLGKAILNKVPELGRWDDLFVAFGTPAEADALKILEEGIKAQNGLCAKWCPRKGADAAKLRDHMKMSPKQYRKTLVSLTNVVESQMCAKQWTEINFSHVPSVASQMYRNAFKKNAGEHYQNYLNSLVKGDPGVKVNAGAIYPHTVLNSVMLSGSPEAIKLSNAQWEALPNFVPEGSSVLPMIDVSGSMTCPAGGSKTVRCMDVSVGLGMYLSTKNTGAFKDCWLNFSSDPKLQILKGNNLYEKYLSVDKNNWGMSTNLEAAFKEILKVAKKNSVPAEEMPKTLMIFSDMQFDRCVSADTTLLKNMKDQYKKSGYEIPNVVFWNLNDHGNSPAKFDSSGVALVSGFSPSIMTNLLNGKLENMTPFNLMLDVLMQERYDF